jgi:hypothetical protein
MRTEALQAQTLSKSDFGADYAAEQLRRASHPIRRRIRKLYLDNILREVRGPTIDFGCGAGQLLSRLPAGSVGLELNPHLVNRLRDSGLNAVRYDSDADDFEFKGFEKERFQTLVISHVLEHFDNVPQIMQRMFRGCFGLGIKRIIVVVPGIKGYRSDATHRTFVTERFIDSHGLARCEGFNLARASYFPGNLRKFGSAFTFHELKMVYDRVAA